MWTRFKDSSWTKKGKWSTGSLGNGMRAFTVVSHLLPNACGGQVDTESSSTFTYVSHNICYREFPKMHDIKFGWFFSFVFFPTRLHAHRLWAVLRLHQVCHWTERTLSWAERCSSPHRYQIQAWSKVHWVPRVLSLRLSDVMLSLLKGDMRVPQVPGGGELGDGVLREAANRRPAEKQEKM